MKSRLMYYANLHPHQMPVQDVIAFSEHSEDIIEEEFELMKGAVAAGVSEALDNLKFK